MFLINKSTVDIVDNLCFFVSVKTRDIYCHNYEKGRALPH